ncbi:tartrate dehydrogenase/decarboxylase/D-malate dehydrogenase [Thermocatellispora tengchongensis]|uniref:D-malate dehydrogenase (decarboxylating) n=1 Tax=Thermocatellispora tengchongensis TaxID=1073253 RepID=A0A840NZ18_9ACTN|nr:tartrate dehydrogenase [Thermocatellispora tengchongensis]MBB5132402.1 tartrate dehydrogenase/decarboxylase/D-malate dehydrogenase [Thermocatellispora tengchongensis]
MSSTSTGYRIAVIPGDGIGTEVIPAALTVLKALADRFGFSLHFDHFDWSCRRYLETGRMMPGNGLDMISGHDAILLGAVGWPGVPDHVSLWGLLIPIRRGFRQYVNLRPIKVMEGLPGPLRGSEGVDFVVVRENVEGEYSEIGGRLNRGFPDEMAVQEAVFTRPGVTRIVDYAFKLAATRRGRLTSATKSNGIVHTMPFWDEIVRERAAEHPGVDWWQEHIDALAAKLVLTPGAYDVIVGSNLFGDILSDLAAAIAGGIGIAPSANINPERTFPSMFEPVHGSAPDIAGRGIANPAGALWSASLMLDHLGQADAARALLTGIERTLSDRTVRTPDLGGTATTQEMTEAVLAALPA